MPGPLSTVCPVCAAPRGNPCRRPSGIECDYPHLARSEQVVLEERWRAEPAARVPCPVVDLAAWRARRTAAAD
jgi:hypothetical protein